MSPRVREVIYAQPFRDDIKRLKGRVHRLEEFVRGAEEILCRDLSVGKATARAGIYGIPLTYLEGNPEVVLYFFSARTHVIFISLRAAGDTTPDAVIM
jgi:hypothetical protein